MRNNDPDYVIFFWYAYEPQLVKGMLHHLTAFAGSYYFDT